VPNIRYTNGIDLEVLLPVLTFRKGWKQPTVADFTPVLSEEVITCRSGMYYNFDHSSCSPVNIWNCQEDNEITNANFNQFLLDLKQQVAVESLVNVFRENNPVEPSKILFEKQFRTQYRDIDNSGKFCGWQLKLPEGNYAPRIESIMLTMNKACTVTLYAFNDLKADPIWNTTITVNEAYNQESTVIDDLILSRLNNLYKGGVIFFGYFQDQLEAQGAKAVDVYLNWWEQFNYVGYQGFEAVSDFANLTFVRDQYFSNYKTYGLNLEISTSRDFTNTVIRNAHAFDKLQGLLMAVKCLELQMNSIRANGEQRTVRDNYEVLYNEIEGLKGGEGIPYRQGLKDRVIREVKRLEQTFYPKDEMFSSIPPVNDWISYNTRWGHQI
jgi:hypothetical protein